MKNSETCERYEIEYQNADYYGESFLILQLKMQWK